jgi:hypothetical protein
MDDETFDEPITIDYSATLADEGIDVDGKHLVVCSGAVLPPFCVKTNRPVEPEDMTCRRLTWCHPLYALLILVSGLLLIILYFVVRKRCTITFGLSPEMRRRYRNRIILKLVAVIVLFFALPAAGAANSDVAIVIVGVLFLIAVFALFLGNSPLAVTAYDNGEFWIAGCSQEFLWRLKS